jgi:hypothetical protein
MSMKKLLALAVVSCGLYLAIPAQAKPLLEIPNPKPGNRVESLVRCSTDDVNITQHIDLTGTLQWVKGGPDPVWKYVHFTGYQITVNGIAYQLPNAGARAASLLGQQVRVKGVLTVSHCAVGRISNGKPVQMDAQVFTNYQVIVTELTAAEPEYVIEAVTVEVRGKLQMHASLGYPKADEVPMITAGGKGYVLQFENHAALAKFAAKYDGKTIVVRGSHGPKMHFPVMCRPPGKGVPSIVVREIEVIDNGVLLKVSVV